MQHLPQSLLRTSIFLGAALAVTFFAGCGHVTHVGGPSGPAPDRFQELEINDSPALADFVTVMDSRSFLVIDGHVEAIGVDVVDHIEFESSEPIEIDFFLEAFGPYGDVDVSIYDPIADEVLATYAVSGSFESGTIVVHEPWRPFQFVIDAYIEDAAWSLELVAFPHSCNCLAATSPESASEGDDSAIDGAAAVLPIEILDRP